MPQQFILIGVHRIRISSIKRYCILGDKKLILRFSSSTTNFNSETFSLKSTSERDSVISTLDSILVNVN